MIQLAEKLGMKISTNFVDFIEKEVLPNTNVTAEKFWHGLATLVNELTPQNKALLDKRRYLQKQINEWHELNSNNDLDLAEYKEFLYSIGYLVPKGESFSIDTDKVDPENVIMSKSNATLRGLTSTVTFPLGNIAPEGSVIKSTAIDPEVIDDDGVYRNTGTARVFNSENDAMRSIKSTGPDKLKKGEILVIICGGPIGTGMEETYQITAALKHLSYGKHIALLTDARFSGVSTGACIGHIGPEALAGGPIGLLKDGDLIEIIIDTKKLNGSINLVGEDGSNNGTEWGDKELQNRNATLDIKANKNLPDDTRLWAALQDVSGGTWGGCVYDVDKIIETLKAGKEALEKK